MRAIVMTLGFNKVSNILTAYHRFHQTNPGFRYDEYVIVDLDFPDFDKMPSVVSLSSLSVDFGFTLLKPRKNRGVSGNWNWTALEMDIKDEDILIGMDPDSDPVNSGWAKAICDVMSADKKIAYCGLTRASAPGLPHEVPEGHQKYKLKEVGGHNVRVYDELIAWPMGAFRGEFIKAGGIEQARSHYGFIEHKSAENMNKLGMHWVMLDEFKDQTSDRGSKLFKEWKVAQVRNETDLDFKDWMNK